MLTPEELHNADMPTVLKTIERHIIINSIARVANAMYEDDDDFIWHAIARVLRVIDADDTPRAA